jgi:hypothetical protein
MADATIFFKDDVIRNTILILKERLNYYGQKDFGFDIVNGIRDYDTYNVPLTEFPLLKVFRISDTFKPDNAKKVSTIKIEYCLSYPTQENLSSICNNINKYIHHIINSLETHLNLSIMKNDRQSLYKIVSGGNAQTVYCVVEYVFSIIEGI